MSMYKDTAELLINNYGLTTKFINQLAEESELRVVG